VTLTCALIEIEASNKRPKPKLFERVVWDFIVFPEVISKRTRAPADGARVIVHCTG
jgi:hypothetical protein